MMTITRNSAAGFGLAAALMASVAMAQTPADPNASGTTTAPNATAVPADAGATSAAPTPAADATATTTPAADAITTPAADASPTPATDATPTPADSGADATATPAADPMATPTPSDSGTTPTATPADAGTTTSGAPTTTPPLETTPAATAEATPSADPQPPMPGATAAMKSADGSDRGMVTLTETASGEILVSMALTGISDGGGVHAIHIHENGVCEGPTFESAGDHVTGGRSHGVMHADGPHAGDLPNVTLGEDGNFSGDAFLGGVALEDLLDSDGSAVVLHAEADDYRSQPSGKSGDRIACGVLTPS